MAKSKNVKTKYNPKNSQYSKKSNKSLSKIEKNNMIMKVLVFLGVIVLTFSVIYLMNYFFVEKNNIGVNMSMDKKSEYIQLKNGEELITSQKYVSDLDYTMRYDINNFKVFKYKGQDIFKYINAEKILLVVEKAELPSVCADSLGNNSYSSCVVTVDDYTEERYVASNDKSYKLTIKKPNNDEYEDAIRSRIEFMINSFEIKK